MLAARRLTQVRWSLLFGNFAIGCGVMVVVGTLNDISRSLDVSVSVAGQLVAAAAIVMCVGAPFLAIWVGGFDRRKLLAASLAWYALGHALSALMPSYFALLPARALTVLGAAVFTPQAAAAIGTMTAPEHRGGAITFIFLGWSLASVIGIPASAWLGDTFGWRSAFLAVAALSAVGAVCVFAAMPAKVRPAMLSLSAWRDALGNRVLMAMVFVTALTCAGQFALFSYFAPYFKNVIGASTSEVTALFVFFGVFGVVGNGVFWLALRRPDRRRSRDALRARAGGAHPLRLAVGHDPDPPGDRHGAMGAGFLRHRVAAAGTPRFRRAAARAGAARPQHLGGLSRPGRRRCQRRLADRASRLRRAQLGWPRLAGRGDRAQRLGRSRTPAHDAMSDEPSAAAATSPGERDDGARALQESPGDLFFTFNRLALQGFGGVLAIAQRELVERKGWLTRQQFVEMLALSQVLPGPNVVNLALMFGDRFFGLRGALAALGGMLVVPLAIVIALTYAYGEFSHLPVVAGALRGMGAIAAGLVMATAFKLMPALGSSRLGRPIAAGFAIVTFVTIAWLRWPLVWVIAGFGSLAVAIAYLRTP